MFLRFFPDKFGFFDLSEKDYWARCFGKHRGSSAGVREGIWGRPGGFREASWGGLGLSGGVRGVSTQDLARAHRVANALESGNVWVNSYNLLPPGLPFGGAKHSGFGRENSAYTLDAYSEIKSVYIQL